MIARWYKHNPPMNEKHFIGIERILEKLPSDAIREAALIALNESWESIAAEKLTKAQRQLKPASGLPNGLQVAMPERLQTPFLTNRR